MVLQQLKMKANFAVFCNGVEEVEDIRKLSWFSDNDAGLVSKNKLGWLSYNVELPWDENHLVWLTDGIRVLGNKNDVEYFFDDAIKLSMNINRFLIKVRFKNT